MQFPESWLRQYCNPNLTTQQLADTLTMAGLEVEELEPVAPAFSGIVVGEIKEAVQHPDADRLRVCQVDVGGPELLNQSRGGRVYNNQQTSAIMESNFQKVALLETAVETLAKNLRDISINTKKTADILRNVTPGGNSMSIKPSDD